MRRVLTAVVAILVVPVAVIFGAGAGGDDEGDYKVRAIFDNASFLIAGQDVKVAGAKVGVVDELEVAQVKGAHKAAVVLKIDRDGFKDFRKDARCEIRLQSVIGEKLVECTPTQPQEPGQPLPAPLEEIPDGQPGAGQRLLPVENTGTPVDADLINSIQRRPFRERFSILLNELGAGLAARAEDIKELLRRGDPALREFDEFLNVLAGQNRMLKQLTGDADRIFKSFAANRESVSDFFVQSRIAAQATAERREDLERNFQKFPAFLRELRPFMDRFAGLSDAMAPVISDLRAAGPDVSRLLRALGPFSLNSADALESLGDTADIGRPALVGAEPVARELARFTSEALSVFRDLRVLLVDFEEHKGIERLMDLLFYQTLSFNGFDEVGHYLRNNLIVTICSGYAITPTIGCSANFQSAGASSSSAASSRASVRSVSRRLARLLGGEPARDRDRRTPDGDAAAGDPEATAPKAQSPSRPAPKPPPTLDRAQGGDDALLDYLLGGEQ